MVMPKKDRFLEEVYNATPIIPLPKGPVDVVVHDKQTNTVRQQGVLQVDEGVGRPNNKKLELRTESRTSNICAASSSSCLHSKQAPMEKADGILGKPGRESTLSYSVNDVSTVVNNETCETKQHTTSETGNLGSVSSSYNTSPENAESKLDVRTSDVFGTSDTVDVSPRLSSGGDFRVENYSTIPNCLASKTNHMKKFNDPGWLEGRVDNISCVYGADEPSMLSNSVIVNSVPPAPADSLLTQGCENVAILETASESKNFKFDVSGSQYHSSKQSKNSEDSVRRTCVSSLSSELSSHHSGFTENHPSGDANNRSDAPSDKVLASQSTSKDSVESCSHLPVKLPGHAGDHLGCDREKFSSLSSDEFGNNKVGISVANQKEIMTPGEKKEVGTNSDGGNSEEPSKPPEQTLKEEKIGNDPATSDAKETSLQCDNVDNSDESDAVEHDVKVCDICGDAGREDLLAICCRCIDGAEHTYCMREMLEKVPKGDWLCEECKLDEENKNLNQEKSGTEAVAEKDLSSGQADTEPSTISIKPIDGKRSDVGEREHKSIKDRSSVKVSGKRRAEESEDSSAVKKQALEVTAGSPRTSSPSRAHTLPCDSSVKDVDSGKAKPGTLFSSGSHIGNDFPEGARSPATGPRLQSSRGAFFKSNSFSIPNARPKTKLVDEVVFQRQKSIKEPGSCNTKGIRGMDKSMSFKSTTSGRFGASDSKVKMMSPKFSHVQDLKSPKNKNERIFERKNSFKSPLVGNSTSSSSTALTPKVDKTPASRGETVSFSSACSHEVKPMKGDSKSIAGLKSTTRAASIGAEVPVSVGEVSRQLPSSPPGVGTASSNGIVSSVEQKRTRPALKDDTSLNVATSKESTNLVEGVEETTTASHLRPSIIPGTSGATCQKCEQTGHSAQICAADSLGSCGLDTSAVKSSKEVINRDNKLRDAIEAAMLKKPGIYRKNKISDQSDESSVSSMNNEVACQDRMPNSNNVGTLSSEMVIDWQGKTSRNCSAGYGKQSNGNDSKQSIILPAEGITSRIDDSSLVIPSDAKHSTTVLASLDAMALFSSLKIPAIPDHEYIWQGSFEVGRNGKKAQSWDGLQAHLSTCASPRVFEAVNKLPHKILLNGVSRLSAWPVQFENSSAKEDNIALYFFAKDIESYERSYQILLEDMMRDDLALIGCIDDVELLIFPSNQLPEKSHRWNMLFFLWGVFREKKKNSLQQVPGSTEMFCMPRVVPSISTDKMSLPEDVCWSGSLDKEGHIDPEFKGNLLSQTLRETPVDNISTSLDSVVVPASRGERVSFGDVTVENVTVSNTRDNIKDVVNCGGNLKVQQGLLPANGPQCEPVKRPLIDLSEDVPFTGTSQINMWHDVNSPVVDERGMNKKQRTGLYGRSNYDNSFPEHVFETALKEKRCDLEETATINPGNSKGERYFFPVDPTCQVKDVFFGESFIPLRGSSISNNEHDRLKEKVKTPNLELALGAELKPSLNQDVLHLVGNIDQRQRIIMRKEDQPPDKLAAIAKEDDDVSASLALSLSFSPIEKDKEDRAVKAFPRAGRLVPGNRHQSSRSLLLFGDIPDK